MKRCYEPWSPGGEALALVLQADEICREYQEQDFNLTLRQLYYQFVARDLIPNTDASYNRLGTFINRGRLAGLLDWGHIIDRTRNLRGTPHWDTPGHIIDSAAYSFRLDKWAGQPRRVEVWVEKEALAGIVERTADRYDVAWFSCRGYVSSSEMWSAAQRFLGYLANGQSVTVLHLGDHDPSGIDMSRDIEDRIRRFVTTDWFHENPERFGDSATVAELLRDLKYQLGEELPIEVRRIALNRDQIRRYNPPPNPAKITDSRAGDYIRKHGNQSWELDALDPATLDRLIGSHIEQIRDPYAYSAVESVEQRHRGLLSTAAARWDDVVGYLEGEAS